MSRDREEKAQPESGSEGLAQLPKTTGLPTRLLLVAIVTSASWWISSAALGRQGGLVPFGIAVVCLACGLVTGPRGLITAALMLLASVPWLIIQNQARLLAMQEDLKDGRWTAHAMDGSFGMLRIGLTAFFRAWLALVVVHVAFGVVAALLACLRRREG